MEIVKNILKLFWTTIGIENNIFPKWAKFSLFFIPSCLLECVGNYIEALGQLALLSACLILSEGTLTHFCLHVCEKLVRTHFTGCLAKRELEINLH